jgi:hypothetical protein
MSRPNRGAPAAKSEVRTQKDNTGYFIRRKYVGSPKQAFRFTEEPESDSTLLSY